MPTPLPAPLSTYPLKKLLELWALGDLTSEQLLGHLLQHALIHEQRLLQLEQERNHLGT